MSLRNRSLVVLISVLAVLALLATLVGVLFHQVQSEATIAIDRLQPAAGAAARVAVGNEAMERGVLAYTITTDPSALDAFIVGRAESEQALKELEGYLEGLDPVVTELVQDTRTSRDRWLYGVAEPQIALVQSGQATKARLQQTEGLGRRSSAGLRTDVQILSDRIDSLIATKYNFLRKINRRLALALIITGLMLLGVTLLASWGLVRLVLRPIEDLREQMRRAAASPDAVITPRGPPEIHDMGGDAEYLRSRLVSEIDLVRAADEGLAQQGPLVSAIRAELASPSAPAVPGFAVWGTILPAEGVLAGDWWNVTDQGDDHCALVVMDISGHGAEAGVTGLQLKYFLTNTLGKGLSATQAFAEAADVFEDAPQRFATGTIVELAGGSGTLRWTSAGQHPPLILRADDQPEWLAPTGPILSTLGGTWTASSTDFASGDVLLCYTDGLVESRDGRGHELGQEGLLEWCTAVWHEQRDHDPLVRVERFANSIISKARERSPELRRDDVTVVAVVPLPVA